MTTQVINYRFLVRGGTAANLAAVNEVPKQRELVYETDTGRAKLGDGVSAWLELPYSALGFFDLTDLADGSILAWDEALGRFKAVAQGGGEGGFPNPMTNEGDLIVGGVAGAAGRLPAGESGLVLTSNGPGASPTYKSPAGGIAEAPSDGAIYGRKNGSWVHVTAPVAVAAAEYWRIFVWETSTTDSFFCGLAEMAMRETSGGGNLAVAGQAIAQSQFTGFASSSAFDGDIATSWVTNGAAKPTWIGYRLPVAASIRSISIRAADTAARALRAPRDFAIQRSLDGLSWETVTIVTGQVNWGIGENRVFNY